MHLDRQPDHLPTDVHVRPRLVRPLGFASFLTFFDTPILLSEQCAPFPCLSLGVHSTGESRQRGSARRHGAVRDRTVYHHGGSAEGHGGPQESVAALRPACGHQRPWPTLALGAASVVRLQPTGQPPAPQGLLTASAAGTIFGQHPLHRDRQPPAHDHTNLTHRAASCSAYIETTVRRFVTPDHARSLRAVSRGLAQTGGLGMEPACLLCREHTNELERNAP